MWFINITPAFVREITELVMPKHAMTLLQVSMKTIHSGICVKSRYATSLHSMEFYADL